MELTEVQFNLLKQLIESNVYIVIIPELLPTDTDVMRENHASHSAICESLTSLGFMTNVSDKFEETINEFKAEYAQEALESGEDIPFRGFNTYVVTETAVRMFSAPEGLVN